MSVRKRYAVYWVPNRAHPLWEAGCVWLGRDPEHEARSFPRAPFTTAPRRYGFHATLKAPMRLVDGVTEAAFIDAVGHIASTSAPIAIPALTVRTLADFVALRPIDEPAGDHPLRALCARCVLDLDCFRAPFDAGEWTHRTKGLDASQRALTSRYGYHFVFDRWRFHMTLSDAFDASTRDRDESQTQAAARAHFAASLATPPDCGNLAVFVEAEDGAPFRLTHRFPLAARHQG